MGYAGRAFHRGLHRAWTLVATCILLCAGSSCGRMQPGDPTTQDKYQVTLTIQPSPAIVGPSVLAVTLKDDAGQPVDGASLEVEANMSHAGMVPVLASAAASQAGLYRVPLQWTMAGDWVVDLKFILPDGRRVVRRHAVGVK
jgi:hypothetical protein